MKSYLQAYKAYERKVSQGIYGAYPPREEPPQPGRFTELLSAFGDLLIRLGTGLKKRQVAGRSMHLSPLSGHKQ